MPISVLRKTRSKSMAALQTQKPLATIPLTHVNSPKTGKLITVESAIRQGFMRKGVRDGMAYLEWTDSAFPPETPREAWERLESMRILKFIGQHESDARPWPPPGLQAKIESDNGRLRLWVEFREDSTGHLRSKDLQNLRQWKCDLIRFDQKRDPLPPVVEQIVDQLSKGEKPSKVLQGINAWIARRLEEWEKVKSPQRRRIDADLFSLLSCFNIRGSNAVTVLNEASDNIRKGLHPFCEKKDSPISSERFKNLRLRKWKGKRLET